MFLHIDGDSFFASCEVALNPKLKGKPVVTGLEKGIASSMSYEAKRKGVTRAMPLFQIRKVCPDAVIVPSNFNTYVTFSRRMFTIVRRYTDVVEEYSIDECFADLGALGDNRERLLLVGQNIKDDIYRELGITVSLGISLTKVLAKVASKSQKPNGLVYIGPADIEVFLEKTPVGKVWGMGPSTSVKLNKLKVFNALEFIRKPHQWVDEHFSKPHLELWHELRGTPVHSVTDGSHSKHKSIMKTRMFKPPSADPSFIFAELSKNIENACIKARHHGLMAGEFSFYLKTQTFRYFGHSVKMIRPSNLTHELVSLARRHFNHVYQPRTLYRATGVTLHAMTPSRYSQSTLFDTTFNTAQKNHDLSTLYTTVDRIDARFGKHALFLASSLKALDPEKTKKSLYLPSMGEVQ